MDIRADFKKAVAAGLAAVTMSGAAYAGEFGDNVRYVDEGQQVSVQENAAPQFPWSKDPRYIDQMQRTQAIYDANLNKIEANRAAAELRCKTDSLNAGARQTNSGVAAHKRGSELGQIGAVLGGLGTASRFAQCQANVDASVTQAKSQLDSSFIQKEDSINKAFERQYQAKAKQQQQASKQSQKAAPLGHDTKVQQACEAAELRAINTGKDLNAVQKKMCKDILKR